MANPNVPPEPAQSITVAELRRRLLSSTPPPMAAAAASPITMTELVPADAVATAWNGAQTELLSRLRMPGKSGPQRALDTELLPLPEEAFPSARPSVTRRTPMPSGRGNSYDNPPSPSGTSSAVERTSPEEPGGSGEVQRLKSENKELRTLLGEMKQLLQEASDTEARYVEREKAAAVAAEEKERQIGELSSQLQMIEDQIAKGELAPPPPIPKTRGEVEEWSDELEKESFKINQERKALDRERQQLREDEESLEKQMREMEVCMARERALIARQETELKRLSAEIQHELEIMQRGDSTLRDQMAKFQRRAQEVLVTRPPVPGGGGFPPGGRR